MRSLENGYRVGTMGNMSGEPGTGGGGLRKSDVTTFTPQEKLLIASSVQREAPEHHRLLENLHFPGKVWFVSNRLPGSYGGLVTAVGAIVNALGEGKVGWMGWSGKTAPKAPDPLGQILRKDIGSAVADESESMRAHSDRVERTVERNGAEKIGLTLTDEQYQKYYATFSNEVLWYLFHGGNTMRYLYDDRKYNLGANGEKDGTFVVERQGGYSRARNENAFATYEEVNKLFAETIMDENLEGRPYTNEEDFIWFQDYHLLLAGKYVREKRPNQKTGFFLHTPFCTPQEFESLYEEMGEDVATAILTGMLHYDLVGFSTPENRDKYIDTLEYFAKHEKYGKKFRETMGDMQIERHGEEVSVYVQGRKVTLKHYYVGIDAHEFTDAANNPKVIEKAEDLSKVLPSEEDDPKLIIGHVNPNPDAVFITYVGRAELTKALYELGLMMSQLVEENPHLREFLQLLVISPLNRDDLSPYNNKNRKMRWWARALNARGRKKPNPEEHEKGYDLNHDLVYMNFKGVSGEELSALNLRSNLALGTSDADGTLLTTKEAASVGTLGLNGVRIGAVGSMPNTRTVDPKNRKAYRLTVEELLSLQPEEAKERMRKAAQDAYEHTSYSFAGGFLGDAQRKLFPQVA